MRIRLNMAPAELGRVIDQAARTGDVLDHTGTLGGHRLAPGAGTGNGGNDWNYAGNLSRNVVPEWQEMIGNADYVITTNRQVLAWRNADGLWTCPETGRVSADTYWWDDSTYRKHRQVIRKATDVINRYVVLGQPVPENDDEGQD